jgi:hypothetical protein
MSDDRERVLEAARAKVLSIGADFFDLVRTDPVTPAAKAARDYFLGLSKDEQEIIQLGAAADSFL